MLQEIQTILFHYTFSLPHQQNILQTNQHTFPLVINTQPHTKHIIKQSFFLKLNKRVLEQPNDKKLIDVGKDLQAFY